ncbi:MAG: hypothetical protein NWF09_01320 [Candidatus Bathyarchaeota archaeon]|nr:hypothetical protein [Candidatus Bathyarchaeota archaeon]
MSLAKLSTKTILLLITTGIILTATTAGVLTVTRPIPATGTISTINLEAYSDAACSQPLTSIDWGTLSPGATVTKTVYLKNTGNVQMTLSMTTNSWSPTNANGPITITWDRESATLPAGQSIAAVITLRVSSSISGITSFSVNIVITGTG